ncbi:unnamed protein product [Adineta steineri]|uniref:Uncharacterized protein n=1 Tax=Adineta steineri TaxID=433720 RepID=A0A815QG19_9BILA|nr:unnamed protein product [Adineta steineri]CAF4054773.1 unnamed protein product [Adineta steineri]
MPTRIHRILFEKKFDDISAQHRATTDNVEITDVQRRGAFVSEINSILSKKSKKTSHLLPPVILQLMRLRFPNDLDKDKLLKDAIDVSIDDFVQWTKNIKK